MNIFSPFNNLYPIVAKAFSKIFFVPFNSRGRNAFYRWHQDLTFGDFCPPTLTLPLGGGGKGGGDAFRDFYATFRFSCENLRPNCFHP